MLIRGDLFDVLPTLVEASVDACVTDPPYGIGFMGREWDTFKPGVGQARIVPNREIESENPNLKGRTRGPASSPSAVEYDRSVNGQRKFQAWTERWAREVYRVLKPGAHLLVCGAPRSYHRMVSGLEDAGFEIRDAFLYWGFGQGFPKSLNVSADARFCQCAQSTAEHGMSGVRRADLSTAVQREASGENLLLDGLPQHGLPIANRPESREGAQGGNEWRLEGRRDVLQDEGQLQGHPVCASAGVGAADGAQGRLHHGASAGDGGMGVAAADARRSGASRRSQSDGQPAAESGTLADEQQSQGARRWPPCDRCGKSVVPFGLGTALKPAYEPIVVARKPFSGTVAANVEKHGTGALNIDACRIGDDDTRRIKEGGSNQFPHEDDAWQPKTVQVGSEFGRWPANVLLDEDAAEMLDAQSGELVSGGTPETRNADKFRNAYGTFKGGDVEQGIGGSVGGASRFYYVAKPSREERDYGTHGLTAKPRDESRKDGNPGGDNPRNRGVQPRGNFHPTVKPVELMRYLVKLVTPPHGTVLDPFTGSGTTGMACRYEQREFIGIEREAEYVQIAEHRIAAVAPLFADAGDLRETPTVDGTSDRPRGSWDAEGSTD